MGYRLGLDLGANSIGWCCLKLDAHGQPNGILNIGVRVFPDGRNPKDGTSLAASRRLPRSMRRNRDRYLRRRRNLLNALTRLGLMPNDEVSRKEVAGLDPYELRAAVFKRVLTPHEFGRVLFHLNQHRGFKSNRKVDRAGDNEGGLIREATRDLQLALQQGGHRTLGEYLAARHAARAGVRVRLSGSGKAAAYPYYPSREMVEREFDALWTEQAGALGLNEEDREAIRHIIFHQRPLKPVRVGRCWLEPDENRAFRAIPSVQAFRIAQDLSHLKLQLPGEAGRALEAAERTVLERILLRGRSLSFDQVRKKLKLPTETDFNLATLRRQELAGAETAQRLGAKKVLGDHWHALPLEEQDAVVDVLLNATTDEQAVEFIAIRGFDREAALVASGIGLLEGTASLSLKAIRKILPNLRSGLTYDKSVKAAGYDHHSDQRTGEVCDLLPYYGELLHDRLGTGSGLTADEPEKRWGRAPNPTVHVALNELRRVVNAIIARHGKPEQIVVETLRELGRSAIQRREYEREQKKNQDANDRRKGMLRALRLAINGDNMMRLRLWEEQAPDPLKRICPYSGTLITLRMALSAEVEEDHILPFSVSLDDSAANRMLVTLGANRRKARRSPFEAFGDTDEWPSILLHIESLPANKRWRFAPDALQKLAADGDFLARHLNDSSTIARLSRMYLEVLAPGQVWSTPGRLTGLLRAKLGITTESVLGRGGVNKSRTDHRHHAIDALVVALTDRSLLQAVSTASRRAELIGRLLDDLKEPWAGFVGEATKNLRHIIVSHKPDIGWQGPLHNDTAYGPLPVPSKDRKGPNVVVRRPLESLADWTQEDIRHHVRDVVLGSKIAEAVSTPDNAERKARLQSLLHSGGKAVRRVRTIERLGNVAAIKDRGNGKPYKVVKLDGNHRVELWRLPSGKYQLSAVSIYDAAMEKQFAGRTGLPDRRPHPAAKLLLRLHKNDMVALESGAARQIMRVVKMQDGQVTLAPHNEGGNLKARDSAKDDQFKYTAASASRLVKDRARKVWVDPSGRLIDPGPQT